MLGEQNVSLFLAFSAGVLSFASPCILPLIPSYVTYITGLSLERLKTEGEKGHRMETFFHSLAFVLGFSIVFISLGASASLLGQVMARHQTLLRKVGGVIVVIFGLHFSGLINIRFLQVYKKAELKEKPMGYLGSVIIGLVFGAGWTPCIGPILASILLYASTAETMTRGITLLTAYSLGLGIPFIISAVAINSFLSFFQGIVRHMKALTVISGILLIIIGVLIYTNSLTSISTYFNQWIS
ncbi:MAG: cytochrome c biogenesis protein CcdA [Deltaproteobacteria bacterium]|nr:cytochrome c biogenesis protein CcdA [Deltaproteobacteria bacterium]